MCICAFKIASLKEIRTSIVVESYFQILSPMIKIIIRNIAEFYLHLIFIRLISMLQVFSFSLSTENLNEAWFSFVTFSIEIICILKDFILFIPPAFMPTGI